LSEVERRGVEGARSSQVPLADPSRERPYVQLEATLDLGLRFVQGSERHFSCPRPCARAPGASASRPLANARPTLAMRSGFALTANRCRVSETCGRRASRRSKNADTSRVDRCL